MTRMTRTTRTDTSGEDDEDDEDDGGGVRPPPPPPPAGPPAAAFTVSADCAETLCRALAGVPVRFTDTSGGPGCAR